MKKQKQKQMQSPLSPARLKAYWEHKPPGVSEQIEALNQSSADQEVFEQIGERGLAAAAQRAWLQDAVVLAATKSTTAEDAHLKTSYLQACLDAWVVPSARSGQHVALAGMITAAIIVETQRWGVGTADASRKH